MKPIAIAIVLAAVVLAGCKHDRDVAPRPNDQDGVERICTPADPDTGTPEICICKTATEATACPTT